MRLNDIFHYFTIPSMTVSTAINNRKRLSSGLSVTSKVFVRSRNGGALKLFVNII